MGRHEDFFKENIVNQIILNRKSRNVVPAFLFESKNGVQ